MAESQDMQDIMIQLNNSTPREVIKKLRANGAVVSLLECERWTQVRFRAGSTFDEGTWNIVVFGKGHSFNSSYPCAWVDLITTWGSGKILWKNPNFEFPKRLYNRAPGGSF